MRAIIIGPLIGLTLAASAAAQPQTPGWQQTLQGLLSGNQGQDQAVREAYERGYQRGRQDEARMQRQSGRNMGQSDQYRPPYPGQRQPDQPYYNR